MKTSDFYFDLPQELIAQDPLEDRSSSRLMVLDKNTGEVTHRVFKDITDYLRPGDCLVINNTKVIPARLYGVKEGTEAKIEILLLKRKENDIWETLVKPGKKCKVGTKIIFGEGLLTGEVVDIVEEGNRLIQFHYEGIFEEILDQLGQMPLPPYITHQLKDKNPVQNLYWVSISTNQFYQTPYSYHDIISYQLSSLSTAIFRNIIHHRCKRLRMHIIIMPINKINTFKSTQIIKGLFHRQPIFLSKLK